MIMMTFNDLVVRAFAVALMLVISVKAGGAIDAFRENTMYSVRGQYPLSEFSNISESLERWRKLDDII